jgi:aminoglycoside phosphotransferase (APT) family kinase protein
VDDALDPVDPVGFASLTPLPGGWSGETFLAEAAGERQVVRIYAGRGLSRGDNAPEIDAALHTLVRGLLPVPEVLDVRRADTASGRPGLLVSAYVEGRRGDLLLPELDDAGRERLGRHLGAVAATLAAMPVLRAGAFVDADLTLGPLGGPETLVEWVGQHLGRWTDWSPQEGDGLLAVADEADRLLDTVGRRCLVHGDLNPKNVLVDPETLVVTAVLDWEFAHAGHPFTDLGNLLRFDRAPALVDGVLEAYAARHDVRREVALSLARAADLWALVDLADRAGAHPVADRAALLVRAIARSGDLSSAPPQQ